MVISIPAKEVAKPEGSSLPGKTIMFESDEEDDDPEVKKQIEAVLDRTDLLGELILLDESESESSDGDDDEDLDETKRYYEGEEETGVPGSKPSSPKLRTPILLPYRRVPKIQPVPGQTPHAETSH